MDPCSLSCTPFNCSTTASVTSGFNIIPVPEPSTALTVGFGLVGLAIAARRRSA